MPEKHFGVVNFAPLLSPTLYTVEYHVAFKNAIFKNFNLIFIFKNLFIYLFLASLGLSCGTQALERRLSSCGARA